MKSTAKPFYFSAYPLKAIKDPSSKPSEPGSPYLKALLSGIPRSNNRVRVFPMISPYHQQPRQIPIDGNKLPGDIELTEKEWFRNYE